MVLGKQGDDCSVDFCGEGLYCDSSSFRCAPEIAQGQPCPNLQGCALGLYCDPIANACLTPPAKGQPCTTDCAWPELCLGSVCSDPVGVGGACPVGDECGVNLVCDPQTHVCEPTPVSKLGEPCQPAQVAFCDAGLICTAGACQVPKQRGAACTVGQFECAPDLLCAGGTCQTPDYGSCK